MTEQTELGRCSARSGTGRNRARCDRPGAQTIDGDVYCNVHAAGIRRSQVMRAAAAQRSQEGAQNDKVLLARCEMLGRKIGMVLQPQLGKDFHYKPSVAISLDDLERIAAERRRDDG